MSEIIKINDIVKLVIIPIINIFTLENALSLFGSNIIENPINIIKNIDNKNQPNAISIKIIFFIPYLFIQGNSNKGTDLPFKNQ